MACHCDVHNWGELKLENATLKENLRQLELLEEELQPSKNDEIAQALVESNIKVVEDRYEIPVPLKQDVVETLPSNYDFALKRTKTLRTSDLKNPGLKDTLTNTFTELINEGWVENVGEVDSDRPVWYLPFFSLLNKTSLELFMTVLQHLRAFHLIRPCSLALIF